MEYLSVLLFHGGVFNCFSFLLNRKTMEHFQRINRIPR